MVKFQIPNTKLQTSSKFQASNSKRFGIPRLGSRQVLNFDHWNLFGNWKLEIGNSPPERGFTIIELLVVLAIMGVLLSIMTIAFQTSRAKSRDATREEHVKTLQNALALYATNIGRYPETGAEGVCLSGDDSVSTALRTSQSISAVPRDPRQDCVTVFRYQYSAPAPADFYTIIYYLETDTILGKSCGSPPCRQQATP